MFGVGALREEPSSPAGALGPYLRAATPSSDLSQTGREHFLSLPIFIRHVTGCSASALPHPEAVAFLQVEIIFSLL